MWICTWTGTKVCQHACGTQQGSGLLTVHLSPSNWMFSSGVIVFPAASSPLSLTRSPLSSCSPHLHIRNSDQHLITPSLRSKHRSISETSTFPLLHLHIHPHINRCLVSLTLLFTSRVNPTEVCVHSHSPLLPVPPPSLPCYNWSHSVYGRSLLSNFTHSGLFLQQWGIAENCSAHFALDPSQLPPNTHSYSFLYTLIFSSSLHPGNSFATALKTKTYFLCFQWMWLGFYFGLGSTRIHLLSFTAALFSTQ